jgi:hypothetical protein
MKNLVLSKLKSISSIFSFIVTIIALLITASCASENASAKNSTKATMPVFSEKKLYTPSPLNYTNTAKSSISSPESIINSLKNVDIFTKTSLKHILLGEINSSGKAVGYHYEGIPGAPGKTIPGTSKKENSYGIYEAKVQVNGVAKTSNNGYSTFYPKIMTPQQVIDSINEAYTSKNKISENTYIGKAQKGFQIEMYLDNSKKIISAFPLL